MNTNARVAQKKPMRQMQGGYCGADPSVKCGITDAGLCNNCAGKIEALKCDDVNQILKVD